MLHRKAGVNQLLHPVVASPWCSKSKAAFEIRSGVEGGLAVPVSELVCSGRGGLRLGVWGVQAAWLQGREACGSPWDRALCS